MPAAAAHLRRAAWLVAALVGAGAATGSPARPAVAAPFPEDHHALARTIGYAEMESFLRSVDGVGPVRVLAEGTSVAGRSLFVVRLGHGGAPRWKLLFYAQQHGNEVSGKDALLYLIRDIARDPSSLPRGVEVWIMPQVNPDGAEADTRRNAAGADLNRDHITLEQPETQALYRVVQRVRPDLAVDCHEFTRDGDERRARGWIAWPDITMDGLNNPLFDPAVVAAAQRWVDEAAAAEARAGHPFLRYSVGGLPPDEEQRHSAPDTDGGLNGIGAYGGLSFIIEAAVLRDGAPASDLGNRVDAYLVLLRRFVAEGRRHGADLAAVRRARSRPLPAFLPTNYLWVNPAGAVTEFPVRELATGKTLLVPTANMMTTMAVKRSVPTPLGYAVRSAAATTFAALLARHAIPFETLTAPRAVRAEMCTLVRVEEEFDELYSRYEGRQIVTRAPAAEAELPAGSMWVPLAGESAVRAALLLEPAALYGLFQYPRYRALVAAEGAIPVLRVVR